MKTLTIRTLRFIASIIVAITVQPIHAETDEQIWITDTIPAIVICARIGGITPLIADLSKLNCITQGHQNNDSSWIVNLECKYQYIKHLEVVLNGRTVYDGDEKLYGYPTTFKIKLRDIPDTSAIIVLATSDEWVERKEFCISGVFGVPCE